MEITCALNSIVYRSFMKKIFLLITMCSFFILPSAAFAKTNVEFLIDFSGSMNKQVGGETQIESAKKALMQSLNKIPEDTEVALRLYGHRVEQANKEQSCQDTELVIPMSPKNADQFKNSLASLGPKGYTPIAFSLQQAKNDFSMTNEAKRVIILLSDGEETCGGDPVQVLKDLKASGFEVVVHTIGFNVDANTKAQLQAIANVGGGKYFDAQGSAALGKALEEATQQSFVIEKEKAIYGNEVQGGNSYETAVPLTFNKELRLNHHQKRMEYDYFSMPLSSTDELKIEIHTLENGVSIAKDNSAKENHSPYMGFEIHGNKRNQLLRKSMSGKHKYETYYFNPGADGTYYFLVGNSYGDQHKDHSTFIVTKMNKGDLKTDKDAGNDIAGAMSITGAGRHSAHLGGPDKKDTFVIDAKAGDQITIGVIPKDNMNAYLYLLVYDDFKQQLLRANSASVNAGFKANPLVVKEDGPLYLEFTYQYGNQATLAEYTIVIKKTEQTE